MDITAIVTQRRVKALAIAMLVAASAATRAELLKGTVVAIKDGDTIVVLDVNQRPHDVRLAGIDAPEKRQPFGERSKQSLSDLVYGRQVSVDWSKIDRWRRLIGKVVIAGRDANLEQVARGLAWHYKAYEREQRAEDRVRYAAAELHARKVGAGLWQDVHAVPPWEWRHRRHRRSSSIAGRDLGRHENATSRNTVPGAAHGVLRHRD